MCGNFSALKERRLQKKLLEQGLDINVEVADALEELDKRHTSLFPSCRTWVLNKDLCLKSASWGLVPAWSRDPKIARHTFNARSETLGEKPSFRDAYRNSRCLVPAQGWWEWDSTKRKTYVRCTKEEQFWFAGLEAGDTFTIVTRSALPVLASLHDRQPVLLNAERAHLWLDHSSSSQHLDQLLQDPYFPELELVPEETQAPLMLDL